MSRIKKVSIVKSIDGEITNIYPITSADAVQYSNELTVKEKIDSFNNILSDTTENWNNQKNLISIKNTIYVYTDYKTLEDGKNIPGIKIGDGLAYVIDLPFIDAELHTHILNTAIHVSQKDRNDWGNKVRCFITDEDSENLQFTDN